MNKQAEPLVEKAKNGDREALESLLLSVQDMVFNLSLRMLGTPFDAQDATQEILLKVTAGLPQFRGDSAFSTWVYRVACNFLLDYKKSMFAGQPLSFDFYGADIDRGFMETTAAATKGVDENLLAEELKQSCTNVMLQCLDPESRLIFVLGVMFKMDSKACGALLGITPEAYRQRLSRIRRQVGDFLRTYCGLSGSGKCSCKKRIGYAIETHRLQPEHLAYSNLLKKDRRTADYIDAMEEMDALSAIFAGMPTYCAPKTVAGFIEKLMQTDSMQTILKES